MIPHIKPLLLHWHFSKRKVNFFSYITELYEPHGYCKKILRTKLTS